MWPAGLDSPDRLYSPGHHCLDQRPFRRAGLPATTNASVVFGIAAEMALSQHRAQPVADGLAATGSME